MQITEIREILKKKKKKKTEWKKLEIQMN
jgi:hypothetical protein